MHKINFWPPRTPLEELTTLPRTLSRMVRGHLSPRILPRSQDIQNGGGGVIGPRDNVFPGLAVALDGPGGYVFFIAVKAVQLPPPGGPGVVVQ